MNNEEILKKLNWTYDSDPGRFSLYEGLINPAMDEARKDATDSMSKILMEKDREIKLLEREVEWLDETGLMDSTSYVIGLESKISELKREITAYDLSFENHKKQINDLKEELDMVYRTLAVYQDELKEAQEKTNTNDTNKTI